ncbi:Dabb family protein [Flavisolibacter sp. BT320]|nr:Dabb family protein [Flavisolibacter longurius]
MFVHHVFFWLKPGLAEADQAKFENGVSSLLSIEHVKTGDVGKPAATDRPVIERSYSYSLLLCFEDRADHDAYQPHPVHKAFVESCSHLWDRVLIYDSESI